MTEYIADTDHYNKVLAQVANVRQSLWIGTADIKDLYVKVGASTMPFLAVIALLVGRGVAWRCGSFMLKNLVRISERILTSTPYSMTVWNVYYARVRILR